MTKPNKSTAKMPTPSAPKKPAAGAPAKKGKTLDDAALGKVAGGGRRNPGGTG